MLKWLDDGGKCIPGRTSALEHVYLSAVQRKKRWWFRIDYLQPWIFQCKVRFCLHTPSSSSPGTGAIYQLPLYLHRDHLQAPPLHLDQKRDYRETLMRFWEVSVNWCWYQLLVAGSRSSFKLRWWTGFVRSCLGSIQKGLIKEPLQFW